jgi:hypothetical protein
MDPAEPNSVIAFVRENSPETARIDVSLRHYSASQLNGIGDALASNTVVEMIWLHLRGFDETDGNLDSLLHALKSKVELHSVNLLGTPRSPRIAALFFRAIAENDGVSALRIHGATKSLRRCLHRSCARQSQSISLHFSDAFLTHPTMASRQNDSRRLLEQIKPSDISISILRTCHTWNPL